MAAAPPVVRRMRAIACLAVAGAVPLSAGTILWVIATVMRRSSPRGWGGPAGAGEVMVLAGLLCGLALIIAAALWQRGMPRAVADGAAEPPPPAEPALLPLTSPEQQAYQAGLPPVPAYPRPGGPVPAYPRPGGPVPAYPRPQPGYPQPGYPQPGYPQPDSSLPAYPHPEGPAHAYRQPPPGPGRP